MTTAETLAAYEAAEIAILTGAQEYQIGQRRIKRAELRDIQAKIRELKRQLAYETNGTTVYVGSVT